MEKKSYSEKLRDPQWQKKRLEVLERDGWCCQRCGDNETTLHVHHLSYNQGKEPWEYYIGNFVTLCEPCHTHEYEARFEYEKMLLQSIKEARFMADDVYAICQGILNLHQSYPPDVTASIIEFALSDGFQDVTNKYWDYTRKKSEQTKASKDTK